MLLITNSSLAKLGILYNLDNGQLMLYITL